MLNARRISLLLVAWVGACTASDKAPGLVDTRVTGSTTGSTNGPPCTPITDGEVWFQDQDGDCLNASLDCDDLDPDVNQADSMWQETVCDGKDNNCDGQVDEGALDGWYLDLDGDGYSGDAVGACTMPAPWSNDVSLHLGVDCDDTDADIHPDTYIPYDDRLTGRDIPGDGVDQDCDGADACAPVCIGGDCDFASEAEAVEFCANWGQAPSLGVTWVEAFELSAGDCLCAPPVVLSVGTRDPELTSLAGIEALWPSEVVYVYGGTPFTFPGLEGLREIPAPLEMHCTVAEWDLHFDGLADVEHMAGLELQYGNIGCKNTDTAVDLTGLDSLRTVDQNLILYDTQLQTLHGLEALEEVGGEFVIDGAYDLVDLSALAGLRRVGADFRLSNMRDPLPDLSFLTDIQSIGGSLRFGGGHLPVFTQLAELGGLHVADTESLDLGQFTWVTAFPDGVGIARSPLTTLAGFENVTSMGFWLWLLENTSLTSLDGLEALASVDGDILLEDNDNLTSIDALANLTTIDGDLEITGNDRLARLDGLYGLQHVSGSVRIENNASLTEAEIYAFLDHLGRENIGLSVFVEAVR